MDPYSNNQIPNKTGWTVLPPRPPPPVQSSVEPIQRPATAQSVPTVPHSLPTSSTSPQTILTNDQLDNTNVPRSHRQGILGKRPQPHSLRIGTLPIETNVDQSQSQWNIGSQGSWAPTPTASTSLPLYANESVPQVRRLIPRPDHQSQRDLGFVDDMTPTPTPASATAPAQSQPMAQYLSHPPLYTASPQDRKPVSQPQSQTPQRWTYGVLLSELNMSNGNLTTRSIEDMIEDNVQRRLRSRDSATPAQAPCSYGFVISQHNPASGMWSNCTIQEYIDGQIRDKSRGLETSQALRGELEIYKASYDHLLTQSQGEIGRLQTLQNQTAAEARGLKVELEASRRRYDEVRQSSNLETEQAAEIRRIAAEAAKRIEEQKSKKEGEDLREKHEKRISELEKSLKEALALAESNGALARTGQKAIQALKSARAEVRTQTVTLNDLRLELATAKINLSNSDSAVQANRQEVESKERDFKLTSSLLKQRIAELETGVAGEKERAERSESDLLASKSESAMVAELLKASRKDFQNELDRSHGLKSEIARLTQRVTELEVEASVAVDANDPALDIANPETKPVTMEVKMDSEIKTLNAQLSRDLEKARSDLEDANVDLIAYKFGGTPPTSKETEAFKATIKANEDTIDQLEDKVKTLELKLSVHIGKGQLKRHREDCQESQRKQTIYRARISGDCIDLTSPSTSSTSMAGTNEELGDKEKEDHGMEGLDGLGEGKAALLEVSSLAEKVYELVTPLTGILRYSAEEHLDNAALHDKRARMDSRAILNRCDEVDGCIASAREGVAKWSKSSTG